jgi:hypothetical protein
MCTILLRWDPGAPHAVQLAANRDEFRERLADDPGEIAPGVFAGRDRTAGGTWLALTRDGVAALTGGLPADLSPYNAFTLLVVDRDGARVDTHEGAGAPATVVPLAPGAHVVDNEAFGRPSPRATRAAALLDGAVPDFALLGDHGTTDGDGLCHHGELYGTVSATVVVLDARFGVVRYAHASGPPCGDRIADFTERARAVIR